MSVSDDTIAGKLQAAVELLGEQRWEAAYKDSAEKEYRVLRLDGIVMSLEHQLQAALDTLTIVHAQKPMAPFKGAEKSEYVPVIKVFNWRSIDSIVKKARNPNTTLLEIEEAVQQTANLTCFEKVFSNPDDFMAFQAMFDEQDIRDHVNGGLLLKLNLDNTTIEGVQEILKRSGLDIQRIEFAFENGPDTVFIPNEAFPRHIRPVTVLPKADDTTQRLRH